MVVCSICSIVMLKQQSLRTKGGIVERRVFSCHFVEVRGM